MSRTVLAYVAKIEKVNPIEGADRIERINLVGKGWDCVCKKGDFKPGDLVAYFEIDSFLPVVPEFEFLRDSSFKSFFKDGVTEEGFRIKTRKLKGIFSQGLVMKLDELPIKLPACPVHGDDLTQLLGVRHYDEVKLREKGERNPNSGNKPPVREFPTFVPKSDQERIENHNDYFTTHIKGVYDCEAKYDGSSCTIFMVDKKFDTEQFGVCSRNLRIYPGNNSKWFRIKQCWDIQAKAIKATWTKNAVGFGTKLLYTYKGLWRSVRGTTTLLFSKKIMPKALETRFSGVFFEDTGNKFLNAVKYTMAEENLRNWFAKTGRSIAIQAELCGPGIQSNRDKFEKNNLYVYDIFDVDKQVYLRPVEKWEMLKQINEAGHGFLDRVDTLEPCLDVFNKFHNLGELRAWVESHTTARGNALEGIVFKPSFENYTQGSFKCVSPKYLLKDDEEED